MRKISGQRVAAGAAQTGAAQRERSASKRVDLELFEELLESAERLMRATGPSEGKVTLGLLR